MKIVALARVIHRQGRLCYYSKTASGRPKKSWFRFSRGRQTPSSPALLFMIASLIAGVVLRRAKCRKSRRLRTRSAGANRERPPRDLLLQVTRRVRVQALISIPSACDCPCLPVTCVILQAAGNPHPDPLPGLPGQGEGIRKALGISASVRPAHSKSIYRRSPLVGEGEGEGSGTLQS